MSALAIIFWTSCALIIYTYLVFPLLLALLVRARKLQMKIAGSECTVAQLPRVAMVVAAHNEAEVIGDKLRNTWAIEYPEDRIELLIGSDGSDDATNSILCGCTDARLTRALFNQRRGKISVLNDLIRMTDADIVVMSDANTIYAPDSVIQLVRHFRNPAIGCVSGELSLEQQGGVSGEGLYWRYENWIKRNESRFGFLIGCNGGIFAIRRELYDPLPPSTIVEDFVISMRILELGYKVVMEPAARAVEPACVSANAEMTRKIRIGAGNWQALSLNRALLHPRYGLRAFAFWGHKVLRWAVPFLVLAELAACVPLSHGRVYCVALSAQLAGIALATLASRPQIGIRLPRWTRPISYFYLMNYALLLGFLRYLFGTQRVTWDRARDSAMMSDMTMSTAAPAGESGTSE